MTQALHEVRLVVLDEDDQPTTIDSYVEIDVVSDMFEIADAFSFSVPFTLQRWELLAPDAEVMVIIDDSRVMTGFIDGRRRSLSRSGSTIAITGRDRGGRLRDESAPLLTFAGRTLEDLVGEIVDPWFPQVTFSNARNRDLIRGRGRRRALSSGEPVFSGRGRELRKKVEPGESRAAVLEAVLEEAGLLGWSTADGKEFVIGLPNYQQAPQWHFFVGAPGTRRVAEINVTDYDLEEDVAERYALVIACGSSSGDAANYGPNVTRRQGRARNNPASPDGTGVDFRRPKTLRIADDDIRTPDQARIRAERELAFRDGHGRRLELTAPGFGQPLGPGGLPALFCCDTIARVEDEEVGDVGDWLVTQVRYRESKTEGQRTQISMVPRGTELRIS